MKYPHEKFIYTDEVHDLPADAWSAPDAVEKTVRYLCDELTCVECANQEHYASDCPKMEYCFDDSPACMRFKPRQSPE